VLARAHYLPLFSRLGAYPQTLLDRAAWGQPRGLFEYWAHEASLLPIELHPLLRWRMARAERGEGMWARLRAYAGERRGEAEAILRRIEAEGPLAASDFGGADRRSGWWEWSDAKTALEWLFWAGLGDDRHAAAELRARLRPHRAGDPARDPQRADAVQGGCATRPAGAQRPRARHRHRRRPARLFPAEARGDAAPRRTGRGRGCWSG
jgi:uncharacterized protein YcaQ